jgi:hypothetical protein
MSGGTKAKRTACVPAGTVTDWNTPSTVPIAAARPSTDALQPRATVSRRTSRLCDEQLTTAVSRPDGRTVQPLAVK